MKTLTRYFISIVLTATALLCQAPASKVATTDSSGNVIWQLLDAALITPTTTAGNVIARVCHAKYDFAIDGGATTLITPASNCTIPANSTIYNVAVSWTTPAVGATNLTSIGTTGTGGGATKLLGATAVASLTGIVQGLVLPSVASGWYKITTSGTVTLTPSVVALTAGVCEIYVFYFTSGT